jgi:hypothetical protein
LDFQAAGKRTAQLAQAPEEFLSSFASAIPYLRVLSYYSRKIINRKPICVFKES